ncbi:DUF5403 family protein [Streptomyces sp. NPDC002120]|uniref:DUF5403 family protein n=1 Tax=Streptomyces sp. NPDC002120 TaxID=3364631 RepID=UPI0036BB93F3
MAELMSKLDEYIAGLAGVHAEVHTEALALQGRIKAVIAPHSKSGRLMRSIKVAEANSKDYIVYCDDPNGLSKNYGHWNESHTRFIPGIHFMERGM